MGIEEIDNLEECRQYVKKELEKLRPFFARAIIGDFSEDIPMPEEDDEFTELYTGIQTMIEVVRFRISALETEIGQRQEIEQRYIARNKELMQTQKAMLNVLEDLQKTKDGLEKKSIQEEKESVNLG